MSALRRLVFFPCYMLQATFLSSASWMQHLCWHGALSLYMYLSLHFKKRAVGISDPRNCYQVLQQIHVSWSHYFFLRLHENSRLEFPSFFGGGGAEGLCLPSSGDWYSFHATGYIPIICKLDAAPLEVDMVPSLSMSLSSSQKKLWGFLKPNPQQIAIYFPTSCQNLVSDNHGNEDLKLVSEVLSLSARIDINLDQQTGFMVNQEIAEEFKELIHSHNKKTAILCHRFHSPKHHYLFHIADLSLHLSPKLGWCWKGRT